MHAEVGINLCQINDSRSQLSYSRILVGGDGYSPPFQTPVKESRPDI